MNPNRGTLLKPSERSGTKKSISISRQRNVSRYEVLKHEIKSWWNDRIKVGNALLEIRDQKLYQEDYETFEAFCESEYGFKRAHAYRLIEFADIKTSIQLSPIGDKITRESQARALAPVPKEKRVEVLQSVVSGNGKVTAKAITEAVKNITPKAAIDTLKDKFDRIVPDEMVGEWKRAEQVGRKLVSLAREIKSLVSEGFAGAKQDRVKDVIYAEISNSSISDAESLAWSLSSVIPFALCPTCQGVNRKTCGLCKKRGWISKFLWNSPAVSEATKKLISGK